MERSEIVLDPSGLTENKEPTTLGLGELDLQHLVDWLGISH